MTIKTNITNAFMEARRTEGKQVKSILLMAVDTMQKTEKELLRDATEIELETALRKLVSNMDEEKAGFAKRGETEKVSILEDQQHLIESFLPAKPILMTEEEVAAAVEELWQGLVREFGWSIGEATIKDLMVPAMSTLNGKADKAMIASAVKRYFK